MQYKELDALISDLEDRIEATEGSARSLKELWESIRGIGQEFKGTRYASPEDQARAWRRFGATVQRLQAYQRQSFQERQRKREATDKAWTQRTDMSASHKDEIILHAEAGRPLSELTKGIAILAVPLLAVGLPDRREELEEWSRHIKQAFGLLSQYKNEMLGRHKQETYEALNQIQAECDEAWTEFKGSANRDRETRREKIHQEIAKLEKWLSGDQERLQRAEDHLTELQEKAESARTDEYRERVEDWIREEEERISQIKGKIEKIEGWMSEQRERLERLS